MLIFSSISTYATCFITGSIAYEDKGLILPTELIPSFPQTPQFQDWQHHLTACSAHAQGQPVYQIIDNQIFLKNLNTCEIEQADLKKLFPDLWQMQNQENQQIWQDNLSWWQRWILRPLNLLEPYQEDTKLKATWLTGTLKAYTGKQSNIQCELPDTEYVFTIENGQVMSVKIQKNPNYQNVAD